MLTILVGLYAFKKAMQNAPVRELVDYSAVLVVGDTFSKKLAVVPRERTTEDLRPAMENAFKHTHGQCYTRMRGRG